MYRSIFGPAFVGSICPAVRPVLNIESRLRINNVNNPAGSGYIGTDSVCSTTILKPIFTFESDHEKLSILHDYS